MDLNVFKKLILMHGLDSTMEGVYLQEKETTRHYWVSAITEDSIVFTSEIDEPLKIMDIINIEEEGEKEIIILLPKSARYIPIEITGFYLDEIDDLSVNYKLKEKEEK